MLEASLRWWRRHRSVWQEAWAQRKTAQPERPGHETAFLPAALALQETPPSPWPRAVLWSLVALLAALLLWACLGRVDVVAVAAGRVFSGDRTQVVQSVELASVRAIHVRDGDRVQAGDLLLELDSQAAGADLQSLLTEHQAVLLERARSEALQRALMKGEIPRLSIPPDVEVHAWQQTVRTLAGQHAEHRSRRAALEAEVQRRRAERESGLAHIRKLEMTLPIVRQREADFRRLMDENFMSRHAWLQEQQARIAMEADLLVLRSRDHELSAALLSAQAQDQAMVAEAQRVALEAVEGATRRQDVLDQSLAKARLRRSQMDLRSPVHGVVQQLAVHTAGGVVTPAQTLMVVVPDDGVVEVEAVLANRDSGFVQAGQPAVVKVETFAFTRYGTVPGEVVSVSRDAVPDEQLGWVYAVRIRLHRTSMDVDGRSVALSPGMAVSAEVRTGTRRVISYFLSPLLQHAQESLRER
ncbi:MAG: hemolysin secretion protein D [Comamonadaceae bacterium]|nr:hemolysin secretion protein D [Comamonadaceae bacterium]